MDPCKSPDVTALLDVVLKLTSTQEARAFFRDLLTEQEIVEFALRWKVVRLLNEGVPYTTIQKETGVSSTTIARISKWLQGGKGGYRTMLGRK